MSLFTHKHVRDLTRRVYLLECETGTQEGLDIREKVTPSHRDHQLAEAQYELGRVQRMNTELSKSNAHLIQKNTRQEKTIRDGGDLRERNKRLAKETWTQRDEIKRLREENRRLSAGGEVLRHEIQRQGNLRMEQANRIVELSKQVRKLETRLAIERPSPAYPASHYTALSSSGCPYLCTHTREDDTAHYRVCTCGNGWVRA